MEVTQVLQTYLNKLRERYTGTKVHMKRCRRWSLPSRFKINRRCLWFVGLTSGDSDSKLSLLTPNRLCRKQKTKYSGYGFFCSPLKFFEKRRKNYFKNH